MAERNAAYFGGKPVLTVDIDRFTAGGDLFQCSSEGVTGLSEAEVDALLTAGTYAGWYLPRSF